jgi:hypothetical protein
LESAKGKGRAMVGWYCWGAQGKAKLRSASTHVSSSERHYFEMSIRAYWTSKRQMHVTRSFRADKIRAAYPDVDAFQCV